MTWDTEKWLSKLVATTRRNLCPGEHDLGPRGDIERALAGVESQSLPG